MNAEDDLVSPASRKEAGCGGMMLVAQILQILETTRRIPPYLSYQM